MNCTPGLGRLRPLVARMSNPGAAERIVTLGYTMPLLCLVALAARWRARGVRFWAWVIIVFAVLSFGPVLPLEDVAEAHTKLERGGMRGKIVLQVIGDASTTHAAP